MLLALAARTLRRERHTASADDHAAYLIQRADSDLERRLIDLLVAERRRLPDEPQKLIAAAQTRPDFIYKERRSRCSSTARTTTSPTSSATTRSSTPGLMTSAGTVIRFHHADDWQRDARPLRNVFGTERPSPELSAIAPAP